MQDQIMRAIEQADNFMNVGAQLKTYGIKYDFATEPAPYYMVKGAGQKYVICASIYADDDAIKVTDSISLEVTKL